MYVPFTLIVFIISGQVNYLYGFVLAVGNIIGAIVASKFAVKKGAPFLRWVILAVVILTALHVFGIIDFKALYQRLL